MKGFSLMSVFSLLAVAGVLTIGSAFVNGQEQTKSNEKGTSVIAKDATAHAGILNCLESLKLSLPQQDQVKDIAGKYAADHVVVWKQFSDRYMATIGAECMLLAAIEDNLTETQREQIRGHRHHTAHIGKALEGTSGKPNQATAKPDSAAEEGIELVGVSLTAEQEVAADKLQGKYFDHLRSLNRDIEGLHARLVALEADKLVAIEKILTKEQLTKLREIRQNAPVSVKVASSKSAPTKTE